MSKKHFEALAATLKDGEPINLKQKDARATALYHIVISFALDEFGADEVRAARFFDQCGIFAIDDYRKALRMIQPRA